ncbi:MAG: helix-turn-helix domain-containing protein [Verrucomicrobiae bacterium]|nr:helix-turn-helix domain-containing protein [Verrucomicrobiae bacterium]
MDFEYSSNQQLPVVAVLFESEFDAMVELYRGVQAYAGSHGSWSAIPLNAGEESVLIELVEHGNLVGLIGGFVSDRWIKTHWTGRMPLVNIDNLSAIESVPSVVVDDFKIGSLVADRFVHANLAHVAYAGLTGNLFTQLRFQGFAQGIQAHVQSFNCAPKGWVTQTTRGWGNWIGELPKPVAVFCATDFVARRLLLACRIAGIRVPDTVSIVGVGNVYRDSLFAGIPISTVELPFYDMGHAAGKTLDGFRNGLVKPGFKKLFSPIRILERASSRLDRVEDELVTRILEWMRARLHEPLAIEQLASQFGISRRSLEQRFRQSLHSSPYAELSKMRMNLARQLLQNSNRKILEVSNQCGFTSQHQFSSAFKQAEGVSPRVFREQYRMVE